MAITPAANAISGPMTIECNRIVDSEKIGLRNRDTTKVDARHNWWGCNLGPGPEGCDSVVAEGEGVPPEFAPWLTLSLSLHDATSFTPSGGIISGPVEAGGSATLFARDANLSSGGLASGPFFREAPVTFASDPAGADPEPGHHDAEQQRGDRHVRVHRQPAADRMVGHPRPSDRPALQPGLTLTPGSPPTPGSLPPGLTHHPTPPPASS